MSDVVLAEVSWARVLLAVEMARERFRRVTAALDHHGILYAAVGGNAAEAWVARIDESAVRVTPDVDILIRRADLEATSISLSGAGFVRRPVGGTERFLDGPDGNPRSAVKLVFSGELPRPDSPLPAPGVDESEWTGEFRLLNLDPLARLMLSANTLVDRVLLRDLIDVDLIDASWLDRVPPSLAARLQHLLDTPDG